MFDDYNVTVDVFENYRENFTENFFEQFDDEESMIDYNKEREGFYYF